MLAHFQGNGWVLASLDRMAADFAEITPLLQQHTAVEGEAIVSQGEAGAASVRPARVIRSHWV